MLPLIAWWVIIQIFGLAALPLVSRVFAWLPDRGYAFAKTVGLLLVSYLVWLGASTGVLSNTTGGILLALLLVTGLSVWVGVSRGSFIKDLRVFWSEHKGQVLVVELLFLLTFAGWALVRAFAPDKILPAGGEKFMEIGFLNGVLNSPRFPPLDPWMAGYAISYYYFGYVMMGVMTRLSGVAPTISFDLYDALTFALTAVTAYGVVANMVMAALRQSEAGAGNRAAAGAFGLLAALFVTGLGNLEGLLEGLYSARLLPAAFWSWIDIPDLVGSPQSGFLYPGNTWWWWHASRVLHDLDLAGQPVVFQPIDEFPFFSFLLGDNHPHKLALPFVLLVIGLAFNLHLRQKYTAGRQTIIAERQKSIAGRQKYMAEAEERSSATAVKLLSPPGPWQQFTGWVHAQRAATGVYLFYALALGSLIFLNTWDFPIYLGLVLLAYGGGRVLAGEPLRLRLLGQVAVLGVGLGTGAILLYIFFFFSFASQAGGVLPYAFLPTRLPQYMVMFGPFIFILAFFVGGAAWRANDDRFPLRSALRAWGWIAGLCFGALLVLLLLAVVVISRSGLESSPYIQTWLGGMRLNEGLARTLLARISDPWLFLLLSSLLAIIVTAIFPRRERSQHAQQVRWQPGVVIRQPSVRQTNMLFRRAQDLSLPGRLSIRQPGGRKGRTLPLVPTVVIPDRPATLFALLVAFTGLALTLVVEFAYLRDNFGMRMNTIFKFYYQGWVMMACASAYGAWWVYSHSRTWTRAVFATGAALLVGGGLVYPLMGIYSRVEGFSNPPNLDAAATFAGAYPGHWAAQPDDWAAIQWLNQNGRYPNGSVPRILEAGSGGYENAGRISAFTGFPTLLGWTNHEGQWRGNDQEINRREPVIQAIFTTGSGSTALDLLRQWQVRYVIIGDTERAYVAKLCQEPDNACGTPQAIAHALAKFDVALTIVFTHGDTTIYQVPGP